MKARPSIKISLAVGELASLAEVYNNKQHWKKFIDSIDRIPDKKHYYLLADAFKAGHEIQKNIKMAAYFYFLAAKYNPQDESIAFSSLQSLASEPHPSSEAYYYLSLCFESGYQTVKDQDKALRALEKAAEFTNPKANHKLGTYYQYGFSNQISINIQEAINYYRLALNYIDNDDKDLIHLINVNLIEIAMTNSQSLLTNKELIHIAFNIKSYYMNLFNNMHAFLQSKHANKLNSISASCKVELNDDEIHQLTYLSLLSEFIKDNPDANKNQSEFCSEANTELDKDILDYLNYQDRINFIAHQLKESIKNIKSTLDSHLFVLEKKSDEIINNVRSMYTVINQMNPRESLSILQTAVSLLDLAKKSETVDYYIKPFHQIMLNFDKPNALIKNTEESTTQTPSLQPSQPIENKPTPTSLIAACARLLPPPSSKNSIKQTNAIMKPFFN